MNVLSHVEGKELPRYDALMRHVILCTFFWIILFSGTAFPEQTLLIGVPSYLPQQRTFPELEAVLREACLRAGIKPAFVGFPMLRDLEEANNGSLDASGSRTAMALRGYPNMVQVPVPLSRVHYVFFSKTGAEVNWKSMAGLRVGAKRGDMTPGLLARKNGVSLSYFNDPVKGFRLLEEGRLDVIIYGRTLGRVTAEAAGLTGYHVSPPVFSGYTYFSLNRKHEAMIPALSDALRDMHEDGTLRRLAGKYASMIPDSISE